MNTGNSNVEVERNLLTGGVSVNTHIAAQSFQVQVEAQAWQGLLQDTRDWRASAERRKKVSSYSGPIVHEEDAKMGAKILATILPKKEFRNALLQGMTEADGTFRFAVRGQDSDIISVPWETCSYPDWQTLDLDSDSLRVQKNSNLVILRAPFPLGLDQHILEEPIEILTAASNPRQILPTNFVFEERTIEESLQRRIGEDRYHLNTLENLTALELRDRLNKKNPHILHVMAHGESGRLIGEDTQGNLDRLDGKRIAGIIKEAGGASEPRKKLVLFVSTACELMQETKDTFSLEVGPALAQVIPFSIGMQLPVSPEVANLFSQEFYAAVARSTPIIDSYIHARQELLSRFPGSSSWVAPVLYVASHYDCVIFETDDAFHRLRKISHLLDEPITALSINPVNKFAIERILKLLLDLNQFREDYRKRPGISRLDINAKLAELVKIADKDAIRNLQYVQEYVNRPGPKSFSREKIPDRAMAVVEALKSIREEIDVLCTLLNQTS